MFLAVAGETLRCLRDEWQRLPDVMQGEISRTSDGSFCNTMAHPKAVYEGNVLWLTTAEADAFRVAISVAGSPGVPTEVSAQSDADGLLGAQTISVYATLGQGEARYYLDGGTPTIYWRFSLRIEEV
jgi:hypothetical protein